MNYPKRLIEVDLPIRRISAHSRREKSIRRGHISTLHIWWARRPLAACRAVICATLWPDPADPECPESFRKKSADILNEFAGAVLSNTRLATEHCSPENFKRWNALVAHPLRSKDGAALQAALLDFIADFANWDNSNVKEYVEASQRLTAIAHEALGGARGSKPLVVDPFAGGGSIPLEVLRVGADAFASDLNPIPIILNKVVLEYAPKYGQRLTDEVKKWGEWVKDQAEKDLKEFYPKDKDGASPVIYLWARTIRCEGPNCGAEVPLLRSLLLVRKESRALGLQLQPNLKSKRVEFQFITKQKGGWTEKDNPKVRIENPKFEGTVKRGSATCPCCGFTTSVARVREQLKAKNGGTNDPRLLTVITTRVGKTGREYRPATPQDLAAALHASQELARRKKSNTSKLSLVPDEATTHYDSFVNRGPIYGMVKWEDYFTPRQNLALSTLSRLVKEVQSKTKGSLEPGLQEALITVLALGVGRCANQFSAVCKWNIGRELVDGVFARQAIPMLWDFGEINPLGRTDGFWMSAVDWMVAVLENCAIGSPGHAEQVSATKHSLPDDSADSVITDPPYYLSVQYADLSDFFYVWLRRILSNVHPLLFSSELTEKTEEVIVQSPTHQFAATGKNNDFFLRKMGEAMSEAHRIIKADGVGVVVFAHSSTAGWEAQIQAMIGAGWVITGSWPIDTELASRVISQGRSVLASSVHLVCRPRKTSGAESRTNETGDWRDVLQELPRRIHAWMPHLAAEGVVGADAIFACLGPALEIFSRYSRVEKASGEAVTLHEFLEHVWAAVAKEALAMVFQGADTAGLEPDARLTAMWLWTLSTGDSDAGTNALDEHEEPETDVTGSPKAKKGGFILEYDAARKIAQGLGANLDTLETLVEVSGDQARLFSVSERDKYLLGKESAHSVTPKTGKASRSQMDMFVADAAPASEMSNGKKVVGHAQTVLDRVHQSMLLFSSGRSEALKRFLVEDGIGRDQRFWGLAQALSALYPALTEEKRWVDGVLARKKVLGF